MTPAENAMTEKAVIHYIAELKKFCKETTKADCDELAQEIRFRVFNVFKDGCQGVSNIQAYIFHTAFFAYSQFARKYITIKKNEKPLAGEVTHGDAIARLEIEERRLLILQAIEEIKNERNREVCRAYFKGVSMADIARVFHMGRTNVKTILRKEMASVNLRIRDGEA